MMSIGARILLVEDDTMIAVLIESLLLGLGYVIVGPASRLDRALRYAREEPLDGAILDVNIRGGAVFPVAELLRARQIPFILASGYGDWALPEDLQGQARLTKPFTAQELESGVRALLTPASMCQLSASGH